LATKDEDPRNVVMVAEDKTTGAVVAFAYYYVFAQERPASEWDVPFTPQPVREGRNQWASDAGFRPIKEVKRKHYKGMPMVNLHILATHPDHQGKGAGRQLLNWGLKKAEELKVACTLEATNEGYRLYKSAGYKDLERIEVDFSSLGIKEPFVITAMMRPAAESEKALE